MRRAAVVLGAGMLLLAGCGSQGIGGPTASKVVGTVPQGTVALAKGDPKAGKALFAANGCGGCHTFKPAGSSGQTGPDLDKLPQYAKQAKQGSLQQFTHESIVNPSAYIQPGYPNVMPSTYGQLPAAQVADLVAFLTKGKK